MPERAGWYHSGSAEAGIILPGSWLGASIVHPVSAELVADAVLAADASHAALVIELDAPGGLMSFPICSRVESRYPRLGRRGSGSRGRWLG